jgi:virginiamycin B lyase
MWFTVEQDDIARVTPGGAVEVFNPGGMAAAATSIVAGPDGNLWAAHGTGVIRIPPGDPLAADQFSYTIVGAQGITVGPDGNIWLAGIAKLVEIPPADPTNETVHDVAAITNPKGMTTGSDGLLWIADQGGSVISATATASPVTNTYTTGGGPQDVAAGPGGQVGYANPLSDPMTVGRITPGGTPQTTPLENTDPFGVTFGQDGAYWIARTSGNDLLRLTPEGAVTTLKGFETHVLGPRKIATGPGNTLWVTIDDPDAVARITGVEPPATGGAPETKITKGPKKKVETKPGAKRAKVRFKFKSPTAGATFECMLKKKGKKARFRPCDSPKRYKLKPARYKFKVRAVAGGVPDPTPAKKRFRVVSG